MDDKKVSIELKLRPLKLAFLVNPKDVKSLSEVMRMNFLRWGGCNNIIVPAYSTKPRNKESFKYIKSSQELIVDSVNYFDPEYVVEVGDWKGKAKKLKLNYKILGMKDLRNVQREDGTPSYGIGLFELLNDFIEKELKFVRTYPIETILPKYAEHQLFFDAVFGALDTHNQKEYDRYKKVLNAKDAPCSMANYPELLLKRSFFLRRFNTLHLERRNLSNACFLMDADEPLDIIDYWNIRALGGGVLPVPKQAWGEKKLRDELLKRAKWGIKVLKKNKHEGAVSFFFSDSITEAEGRAFIESLGIPKPTEKFVWHYTINSHIRTLKHIASRDFPPDIESKTEERIVFSDDRLEFKTLDPEFADRFGGQSTPRFANEITFRSYSSENKGLLAEIIPQGGEEMIQSIGGMGDDWHFSRRGIVYLSQHLNWTIYMSLPKAEPVFKQMLKAEGWKVELSLAGKTANLIFQQTGGVYGIDYLKNEKMIKFLDKENEPHKRLLEQMNTLEKLLKGSKSKTEIDSTFSEIQSTAFASGKPIDEHEFNKQMHIIANDYPNYLHDFERLKKGVCDIGMFRVGITVQCPICRQSSWYAFNELQYDLRCSKCLQVAPIHTWESFTKSYRTFGPFSLPGHAQGAYAVLVTLDFFKEHSTRDAVTPMMSFTAKKQINGKEKEIEADLGMFITDDDWYGTRTRLILFECKTYNELKSKDFQRMLTLASEFPNAILAFSTLKRDLGTSEKKMLLKLLNVIRRQWNSKKSEGNLLILTGNELFDLHGPPYCWKGKGGDFDKFAKIYNSFRGLNELCDITLQLYLGADSESQWRQLSQVKRHLRKKANKKTK